MNADNVQVQGKQKGPSAFSDSKPISKSSLLSVPSVLSAVQLVLLFIARYQECNRDRHSGREHPIRASLPAGVFGLKPL
jgi:hypothetical protein